MTNEIKEVQQGEIIDRVDLDVLPALPVEDYDLTQRQLLAAQLIIVNDSLPKKRGQRKTYSEIAAEVGISRETLHEYRSLPDFKRYVRDVAQVIADDYVLQALSNMKQLADGSITGTPSIGANMFFLENAGMVRKKQEHTITMNQPEVQQVSDEQLQRIIARATDDE